MTLCEESANSLREPPRRNSMKRRYRWALGAGVLGIGTTLCACNSLGPRQLPLDRFDYNTAIANSASEQMLLNLVRLRHSEAPTFLAVNSVITQYVWTGEAGVSGGAGENLNFPAWTVGGSANARYVERPTVTYSPLSGQEFATQLISPVRADVVFSLVSAGWPPDQLLRMTLQRVNDIENIGFAEAQEGVRAPDDRFVRMTELIIRLAQSDSVELVRSGTQGHEELFLDFAEGTDAESQALIREFKQLIGLKGDLSRYRVTRKIVGRAPDEITIRMHSLLELMGLLCAGVAKTPEPQRADAAPTDPENAGGDAQLRVRCHRLRPEDAFVSVRYGKNWYEISRSDERSMRAFGLLLYLFQVQASQNQGAGPLLTVPVG